MLARIRESQQLEPRFLTNGQIFEPKIATAFAIFPTSTKKCSRSLVEVDPETSAKVKLVFELYAYRGHTLDSLIDKLAADGVAYSRKTKVFKRLQRNGLPPITVLSASYCKSSV